MIHRAVDKNRFASHRLNNEYLLLQRCQIGVQLKSWLYRSKQPAAGVDEGPFFGAAPFLIGPICLYTGSKSKRGTRLCFHSYKQRRRPFLRETDDVVKVMLRHCGGEPDG